MVDWLAVAALVLAGFPALLYFANARLFRPPAVADGDRPAVSLLIPARNEAAGIRAALDVAIVSAGVELEVIVLDDHSTDGTADIVREMASLHPNVRVEPAPPLPAGWNGKQHACWHLAGLARHETISFLDADVRLAPTALLRMHGFLRSSGAALVSGFPRQETGTLLERLVVPLINWLLLCYLPIARMRTSGQPGLGAGCGQWFTTTKTAYQKVGGHSHPLVRASKHDGLKLPRAYRTEGLTIDFCDATDEAACRMYHSAGQTWNGFAKNAGEGMGGPVSIWVWSVLLLSGHVLPFVLLFQSARRGLVDRVPPLDPPLIIAAVAMSWLPRFHAYRRFHGSLFGAALHPLGVAALVSIQWYALIRRLLGRPVGWKGR